MMIKHKQVLEYIAQEFGVDKDYYNNKKRYKSYMLPRKMACWALYIVGGITMQEVAKIIGYAEHSTVQHHIHDYWNMCMSDDEFRIKGENVYSKSIEIYETT